MRMHINDLKKVIIKAIKKLTEKNGLKPCKFDIARFCGNPYDFDAAFAQMFRDGEIEVESIIVANYNSLVFSISK